MKKIPKDKKQTAGGKGPGTRKNAQVEKPRNEPAPETDETETDEDMGHYQDIDSGKSGGNESIEDSGSAESGEEIFK